MPDQLTPVSRTWRPLASTNAPPSARSGPVPMGSGVGVGTGVEVGARVAVGAGVEVGSGVGFGATGGTHALAITNAVIVAIRPGRRNPKLRRPSVTVRSEPSWQSRTPPGAGARPCGGRT